MTSPMGAISESSSRNNHGRRPAGRGTGRRQGRDGNRLQENGTPRQSNWRVPQTHDTSISLVAAPAKSADKGKQPAVSQEEVEEDDVCVICASPITYLSIAPCNHVTCHICALRMRALYNAKACAHCRTESDFIVFTDISDTSFQELASSSIVASDDKFGIKYTKLDIQEEAHLLLRFNCPDPECDVACQGWRHLIQHVKFAHGKVMCELCTRNKKVFTHEHELFSKEELRKHERKGDDKPGAIDQTGFKGHPRCEFCAKHFYDDDELYKHCRGMHFSCEVCDRVNRGRPVYYPNYAALQKHIYAEHFPCLEEECLEKKFIFFSSELDLKAHQLEKHASETTKATRRIDLSEFDVRDRYVPERGGRHRDRPRGAESSAGDRTGMNRAPQQRISRSQAQSSVQQLTSAPPQPPSTASSSITPLPSHYRPFAGNVTAFSSLSEVTQVLERSQFQPQAHSEPQVQSSPDQVAQKRRAEAVLSRATTLLKSDSAKLDTFNSSLSKFKTSNSSASDFVDTLLEISDSPSGDVGKLVHDIADFFAGTFKQQELNAAWNEWKATKESFPSLPAARGGSRLIKLKSSTAQSNQSAVNRAVAWTGQAPKSTTLSFPSRSTTGSLNRGNDSWPDPSSAPSAPAPRVQLLSSAPRPNSYRRPHQAPSADTALFPDLPPAAKPQFAKPTPFVRPQAKATNAWTERPNAESKVDPDEADAKKGKKGKKKAQVLMHWG